MQSKKYNDMFTKPINLPVPPEIKQKPCKKWFNKYVLCFLFLILCVLLVLAYRIEVKIIQQNSRKNYDDYIEEIKKGYIEEEISLILEKNHYDVKGNGEDYDVINVEIVDNDNPIKTTKTIPSSSEKPSSTASVKEEITSSVDLEEVTENYASEKTSVEENIKIGDNDSSIYNSFEEDDTTTKDKINKTTSTPPTGKVTPKLLPSDISSKTIETSTQSQPSTSKSANLANNDSKTKETTTKAIKVEEYITKSNKGIGNKNNTEKYYDPKKKNIVVIQVEHTDYPDINTTPTTDRNKKYYHLPKEMFELGNDLNNNMTSKTTTVYQGEDLEDSMENESSSEENIESNYKESISETEKNNGKNYGELDIDPPNEMIRHFQSNVDNINNIITQIHNEVSKQINKNMADMSKNIPPMNMDLDFEIDPFYDRSNNKVKTSSKILKRADPLLVDDPILQ